jgi:SAM-dependent methyltransferase
MVHQQLARLLFLTSVVDLKDKRVLEFGCGSGLNCAFLQTTPGIAQIVGFDVSSETVALAQEQHPEIKVFRGDGCDEELQISRESWDVILSFEVLEHVLKPSAFLANIRRHLAPDGIAFITTPNREVFSLGHEPSPVNREHTKEFSLEEFMDLVRPFFSDVEIWGQKFERDDLQMAWKKDVLKKIDLLQRGERWRRQLSLREKLLVFPAIEKAYRIPALRKSWKYFRWKLWHEANQKWEIAKRPYGYADFIFTKELSGALWFCAKLKV